MKHKLLIIGLDAMSLDLANLLVRLGIMPHLGETLLSGVYGHLQSTIPPMTAPAWTSILTGVNPGRHGIFDFVRYDKKGPRLLTSLDVKVPRLPEILTAYGIRSLNVNMPLSYPVSPIRGVIITDWLSPQLQTYPYWLKKKLEGYVSSGVGPLSRILPEKQFTRTLVKESATRLRNIANLLIDENWEVAFILFSEPDWIFHKFLDKITVDKDNELPVLEVLRYIDEFIGFATKLTFEDNGFVMLLSDHGSKTYRQALSVNSLLHRMGLTRFEVRENTWRNEVNEMRRLSVSKSFAKLAAKLPYAALVANKILGRLNMVVEPRYVYDVDMTKSLAFMPTESSMGIVTSSQHIATQLISYLNAYTDSKTGQRPIAAALLREEVYSGPFTSYAPHVIMIPNYERSWWIIHKGFAAFPKRPCVSGVFNEHSPYGFFAVAGPNISRPRCMGNVCVYDVLPTILRLLEVPQVPAEGRPMPL